MAIFTHHVYNQGLFYDQISKVDTAVVFFFIDYSSHPDFIFPVMAVATKKAAINIHHFQGIVNWSG